MVDNNKSMRIRNTLLIACCILLVIVTLCKEKRPPKSDFYAFKGGWGEMNIPLVKPFNLFCYDGKNWMVNSDGYTGYKKGASIDGVKRFQGSDSLFLFRSYGISGGVYINGKKFPKLSEGWFIIDVVNKTINGYTYYGEFRDTLFSQYQITVDTSSWRTPRSYYNEFKRKGTLPWFPDNIW